MSSRRPSTLTFRDVTSQLGVIVVLSVLMGVLVAGLAIPFAGVLSIGGKALTKSVKNLPEQLPAEPLAERSRVLDANGRTLATFYDENRINVRLADVSPIMRKAIIAIEDYRYYHHGAIDIKGTLRAFLTNQANNGVTQGGSSITQQLAKMTLLSQAKTEAERKAATADTYQRKIQELRYAIGFEQKYSKDWILERYLNIAYFGDGVYGIQSAARHYFSVNANQLDTRQAALLAGLVKNPVGYDPTRNKARAVERRNIVLARMAQLNVIPTSQADQLEQTGLGLKIAPMRNGCLGSKAAFFCDYVRRYLLDDPALGKTLADREQLLNAGGLTIRTTLNLAFQKAADAATAAHVHPTDNAIGALAEVQPGTGNVFALSQSRPMGRDGKKGETFLDYVVPRKFGDANGFQAGSTFKLFVLASALEQGLPTTTSFHSPNTLSIPQNDFQTCDGPYPVYAPWVVHNSTGEGTFNMYRGTQQSVNTFYAQLEKQTGLCQPYALARSMGVDLTDPTHQRVPSFTLGIADVSPLEMASAYATVAARGLHCDARPVTAIYNSEGRLFKAYPKKCQQVMQQNTADTINDILRGVMAPGGFGQALTLDKQSAGKTGTISDNMAVWFDGYTPAIATVSMIAGANQVGNWITLNGQTVGGQYIATAHGSTTAGPMWADAMRAIQDLLPNVDFVKPTKLPTVLNGTIVPNVVGLTVADATATLQNAGFLVTTGSPVNSTLPAGLVAATNPTVGSAMTPGSAVTIYASNGSGLSTTTGGTPGGTSPSPPVITPPGSPTGTPTGGRKHGHGPGH